MGVYVNGALCEQCPASNATILKLQNLTALAVAMGKRLIYECHGSGNLDEIAAFLIGAGEYHYYGSGRVDPNPRASAHAPRDPSPPHAYVTCVPLRRERRLVEHDWPLGRRRLWQEAR